MITAPVAELIERERYPAGDGSWRADLTQPGLVIDLDRRVNAKDLGRCFAQVIPAGALARGEPSAKPVGYTAFVVSRPTRDVLHQGCG